MAIKFSQFNERTESTATMSLVGYDGEQNIRILADDLLANPYINGTENTLAMFGTGGTIVVDSIVSQDAGATLLTVAGQLNVDAAATFDTSIEVTGDSTLNGNVTLGDTSADLITQTGTLYLNGPIKDTTDTLGAADQILVSDASGELTFTDLTAISTGTAQKTSILVKNIAAVDGGVTLTKGTPVYIYGSVGASERLYIDAADASNAAKMPCVGLLDQDLLPNGEGTATVTGKLKNLITSPIDGVTPTENDTLYVKPGGGLTLTKPTGVANLIQNVGQVGRVSTASDGNIVVSAILRSNDIPNLTQGKIWVGSTGNTIESATVHLDEATNRLGVNNVLPSETLDVEGTLRSTGFAYLSTDGPTSFINIGASSSTISQLNLVTTTAGSETSIVQGSRTLRLRVDNTDTKSIYLNNGGEVSLAAYGGGTITGTAAYNLSVDASGNIIETTAVPGNVVETLTAASGTYISLTDATSATGDVNLGTFDLSAIDGVAAAGERYLTKNNTWAEVATIPGTYTFNVSDGTASTTINSGDTLGILGGTYITTSNTTGNVTISHDTTSRTDTTSTDSPGVSGSFTAVDSVTTNATGHVTAINVKTVTLPDDGVDGSGTLNYVAKWTPDGDTLGNSIIYDNGTNVGVGTNLPTSKLHITNTNTVAKFGKDSNGSFDIGDIDYAVNNYGVYFDNSSYPSTLTMQAESWTLGNPYGGISGDDNANVFINTNFGAEAARFTYDGKFGIGTTNPARKFTIETASNPILIGTSTGKRMQWENNNYITAYSEDPTSAGTYRKTFDFDGDYLGGGYVGVYESRTGQPGASMHAASYTNASAHSANQIKVYKPLTGSSSILLESGDRGSDATRYSGIEINDSRTPVGYPANRFRLGASLTTEPTIPFYVNADSKINGDLTVTGAYYDSSNSAGTSGQVLSSTGTGTSWVAAGGSYTPSAISTNTNAVNNYLYILTANLTLTLPASPSAGDSIKIANFSGVTTCVIARNGNNIMASATDLTLDNDKANFELVYTDATRGWVIIGATGELN